MDFYVLQHLLYFFILYGLDRGLLSEHIIGDVYNAGRLEHDNYSSNDDDDDDD